MRIREQCGCGGSIEVNGEDPNLLALVEQWRTGHTGHSGRSGWSMRPTSPTSPTLTMPEVSVRRGGLLFTPDPNTEARRNEGMHYNEVAIGLDPARHDLTSIGPIDTTEETDRGITASGGWCAPTETVYDMVPSDSLGLRGHTVELTLGEVDPSVMRMMTGFPLPDDDDVLELADEDGDG